MPHLRKRIDVLERSLLLERDPDPRAKIARQALHHLKTEELEFLETVLSDGKDRALTPQERAAVEASNAAFELECKRAGFSSLTEFQHLYSATRRR
jgi:hypothetical protein